MGKAKSQFPKSQNAESMSKQFKFVTETIARKATVKAPYDKALTKLTDGMSFKSVSGGMNTEIEQQAMLESAAKWHMYHEEGEVCVDRLFNIRTRTMKHHSNKNKSFSHGGNYSPGLKLGYQNTDGSVATMGVNVGVLQQKRAAN